MRKISILLLSLLGGYKVLAQTGNKKATQDWFSSPVPVAVRADMDSTLPVKAYSVRQIRQLFQRMHRLDQQYRDSVGNGSKTSAKQAFYWRKIKANDQVNQVLLAKIITAFGWPTISKFGAEASDTAWLIAWHADAAYIERYYNLMERAYHRQEIKANSFHEVKKRFSR